MSTRPLQLSDENLPPRKRQRNFMNYDSNFINNSFTNSEMNKSIEFNNSEISFKNDTLIKSEQDKKENISSNINNTKDENDENNENDDLILINNNNKLKNEDVNDPQIINSDDQIDIIGNVSEDEEQTDDNNSESEEEMERNEIDKEFDEETKQKLRSEAHELGFDAFIAKYGYYSARSLISLFDVELPPELDNYKNFELLPLLKIIMARFNRRRQKLKTVNTIEDVVELLKKSNNIIVLTGAGVSVSCGIPDFRSENGVYSRLDEFDLDEPQQMFDLEYFKICPKTFYSFAHELYPSNYEPSPSHKFIKLLEDKGKLLRNYTQNIDTLEQKAGITKMVQCHGSFATASCIRCGYKVPGNYIEEAIFKKEVPLCPVCPKDADDAILKPNIIFFGEKLPDEFGKYFQKDREKCDLLIVMGSSLKVSPVADIIGKIPHHIPQILINLESLTHVPPFDVQLLGYSDNIIKELCRRCDWELGDVKIDKNEELKYTLPKPSVYLFEGAKYNEAKTSKVSLISALFAGIDSDSDSDDFPNDNKDQNNINNNNNNNTNSNFVIEISDTEEKDVYINDNNNNNNNNINSNFVIEIDNDKNNKDENDSNSNTISSTTNSTNSNSNLNNT